MTPEWAAQLLETNDGNRNLRRSLVDRIAEAIRRGEWRVTGQAIQLDTDGKLIDGQHRLAAIVKAGQAVQLMLGAGFPREVQGVIDTGAARTAADYLRFRGCRNTTSLAATLRMVHFYNAGQLGSLNSPLTNGQLWQVYEASPGIDESVTIAGRVRELCGAVRVPATFHYIVSRLDEPSAHAATEFIDRLATGEMLEQDSPIRRLREVLLKERAAGGGGAASYGGAIRRLALFLKSWNYHAVDEPLKLLRWRRGNGRDEAGGEGWPTPIPFRA